MATIMYKLIRYPHSKSLIRRFIFSTRVLRDEYNIQNEEDFKTKVIQSTKPVIVDFHAVWCGPCKTLGPLLSDVVASRNDKVDLAKVDIDRQQELAIQYGVSAVPTVLLMKDGEMTGSFVGLISKQEIEEFVPKE